MLKGAMDDALAHAIELYDACKLERDAALSSLRKAAPKIDEASAQIDGWRSLYAAAMRERDEAREKLRRIGKLLVANGHCDCGSCLPCLIAEVLEP